jgi:hypothetical protein
MNPIEYLRSLIEGQKVSSIPVQVSELELLLAMLREEQRKALRGDNLDGPMIKMFRD